MTARIAPLQPPFTDPLRQRFDRILPPGLLPPVLFRTVAHNESLFTDMVDMGLLGRTGLLDRRALARPLRELIILRTCVAAGNDYEWNLHVKTISERMGLTPAQIADTRTPEPSPALWSDAERAAMRLADALVHRRPVADDLYAALRRHFDEATLIEMTLLTGLYTAVAMVVALAKPEFDDY